MSASVTARLCGKRVEVLDARTERAQVWALPEGGFSSQVYGGPVRFRQGEAWQPVDLTLRMQPDGSVAPVAHPGGLRLAGKAGTEEQTLVTLNVGGDVMSWGWTGSLPVPSLSGNEATYRDVFPGVDMVLAATRTGFEQSFVVHSRAAAARVASVTLPVRSKRLRFVGDGPDSFAIRDAAGVTVGRIPTPTMWDARRGAAGEVVRERAVGVSARALSAAPGAAAAGPGVDAAAGTGAVALSLVADPAWLNDPATVYPVTIDPVLDLDPSSDTYVRTDETIDRSGAPDMFFGKATSFTAQGYMQWPTEQFGGAYIRSATLHLWNYYSGTCVPNGWQVFTTAPYANPITWATRPAFVAWGGYSEETRGYSTSCDDNWIGMNVRDFVQRAADTREATSYMGLKAYNETQVSGWKQVRSLQAVSQSQVPYITVDFNAAPFVSNLTTSPSTSGCVSGASRPWIASATPRLQATVTDADSGNLSVTFEWAQVGGVVIGSNTVTGVPSNTVPSVTVPAGVLQNGGSYAWRVSASDGTQTSAMSAWCEFSVDTAPPGTAPSVSSITYPEGAWAGGAGTPGTFVFGAAGVSDVVSYLYGLDVNPPTTSVTASSLGGNAAVSITPTTNLPHTLYVQSVDRAGNASPVRFYQFGVGSGGVLLPRTGDLSATKFALQAQGQPGATGVTYEWRRGDADAWTTIPIADVTVAAGGGVVTWPQASSGGGAFAKLNWDVAATLNNAEAGPDPRDGPLQVRASFTGSGGVSEPVKVALDLNRAWASTVTVGPGNVNLITGNFGLAQTDVDVFGMGLSRTFNTRQAAELDPMFGPGWASSAAAKASFGYTRLTVTGSLVQIGLADGAVLGFSQNDAGNTTFDPQVGFENYKLTRGGTPAVYTLVEPNGNRIVFTQPVGAAEGIYAPSSVTPAGTADSSTVSWELVPGSTTEARPTRILASVPSGVECTNSLVRGCRTLTFTYATATTATGTAEAQWGSFVNRLVKVDFVAYDPGLTPTPGMRTIEVARYAYDSTGRLRAAWDPRLDWTDSGVSPPVLRHLQRTFTYDGDGMLTEITPPGQAPWQLAYTTVPADSGRGRIATVSVSTPTAGTAVSAVVYRVPGSGNGAPYDLSAAQTVRWGQAEAPTDAAAVFPPTQIPDGNQATGVLPSSFESATVTYMDANGRTVNTAAPGGGIDATWYDQYGNVTRTLTAGNRKRALDLSDSDTPAQETILANARSTRSIFTGDGQQQLSKLEPEHDVVLPDGSVVRGRAKSSYTYDEGAPATGGPYRLVTTQVDTVAYWTGGVEINTDAKTTKTEYDWSQRKPTKVTVDPGGLDLVTRYAYDANGRLISTTTPAGGSVDTTPSTRRTVYYQTSTGSGYAQCDNGPNGRICPAGSSPAANRPVDRSCRCRLPPTTCTASHGR